MPILVVLSNLFRETGEIWDHLVQYKLKEYVTNSLWLILGVGLGTGVLGFVTAWLVTFYDFWGRKLFQWLLLLPLAMPAYLLAYTYTDLLEYAGPVQSALRAWFGWTRTDYWFPEIRSLPGAVLLLSLSLYPYVYLLTRATLLEQSSYFIEAGKTLGRSRAYCFFNIALPTARPALIGGISLALMETLADYGTVDYFAIDTFTTGIYRTWFGMQSPVAAAYLSSILLLFVVSLIALERWQRKKRGYVQKVHQRPAGKLRPARPLFNLLFFGFCALPLLLGFVVPAVLWIKHLVPNLSSFHFGEQFSYIKNSLSLALLGGLIVIIIATILAYCRRNSLPWWKSFFIRLASMGYAIPGSIIAVGILLPLAKLDNGLDAFFEKTFGISTGLLLTGSIFGLLFAYAIRFMAVAMSPLESSLQKISVSMDWAGRTLGLRSSGVLTKIHLPIMRPSLLTAGLLVFVDILKELPATLILRPFNYETLSIRVYNLASDERLAEASFPALTIIFVGIIPIILLSRMMDSPPQHSQT